MTTVKTCFKCEREKPVDEFYRHPQMADGRLSKCKECTRQDVKANRDANRDYYLWFDRVRANLPHRVASRKVYAEMNRGNALSAQKKDEWRKRNTDKARAHRLVRHAIRSGALVRKPCEVCGETDSQAHHDDYTKPLAVRWLCSTHHGEHHRVTRWRADGATI